jgi:hypothetical protein
MKKANISLFASAVLVCLPRGEEPDMRHLYTAKVQQKRASDG